MKEYGRKPYIAKTYRDMMDKTPNKAIWDEYVEKHSEFEKPYADPKGDYSEMQYYHPPPPGISGDYPGIDGWSSLPFGRVPPTLDNCTTLWNTLYRYVQSAAMAWTAINMYIAAGCPVRFGGWLYEEECPGFEYTTNQMDVDETQQFEAPAECDDCEWGIASGGGTISEDGLYTAPSSNENCEDNPTITLTCDGDVVASLKIAVDAYGGSDIVAWSVIGSICSMGYCRYQTNACYCNGYISEEEYDIGPCNGWEQCQVVGDCGTCGPILDLRTEEHKTGGCCPAVFL